MTLVRRTSPLKLEIPEAVKPRRIRISPAGESTTGTARAGV